MNRPRQYKLTYILLALLPLLLSTACNFSKPEEPPIGYEIAPELIGIYERAGGEDVLGIGISPSFPNNGNLYQYTVGAVLVYNSQTGEDFLYPLARDWEFESPDEDMPEDVAVPYVNGHQIWEELIPLYETYGVEVWGLPLTGVQGNDEEQRFEQLFERIGFYRNYGDPFGTIHVLHYGDWVCGDRCSYDGGDEGSGPFVHPPIPPSDDETLRFYDDAFMAAAERLGWDYTDRPFSSTYWNPDGFYEKIFGNVVMYYDAETGDVELRELGSGYVVAEPPAPCVPEMNCYITQDDMGYNIPDAFLNYIAAHGGLDASGPPITQVLPGANGGIYQCYTNVCLAFDPNAPEELRIGLLDLGRQYKLRQDALATPEPTVPPADDGINLYTRARYPFLDPGQAQEIEIAVYRGNLPLPGANATLWVTMPDGSVQTYLFAPTDANGQAWLEVTVGEADLNTIFPFGVCVVGIVNPPLCEEYSFQIWDSP